MTMSLTTQDPLRIVLQATPTATAYWDRDLTCRFANDAHVDWFGITADAMVGMHFGKLLSPQRYALMKPVIDQVLAGAKHECEVNVQRPDGSQRPTLIRYTPHVVSGRVTGFIAEATDVTLLRQMHSDLTRALEQQKHTEALLKSSQLALRQAQDLAQIGSWKWDIANDAVEWSDQIYELFGLDPAVPVPGLAGQRDWYTEESMKRLNAAARLCASVGIPYNIELEYIHRSGRRGWLEARGRAIRDDQDRIVELLGTVQDVSSRHIARALPLREQQIARLELELARETELRQMLELSLLNAESTLALHPSPVENSSSPQPDPTPDAIERTARLELIGTLACGIAHDFNNVLASVAGATELIVRTSTEPRSKSLATQGRQAVHRASRLVQQLMGLVRNRKEGLDPMQILDVTVMVDEARAILQTALGPRIALHIESMLPIYVRIDRHQVETALLNLAVNAGAAMPQGGRLTIRIRLEDPRQTEGEKARSVWIDVQDSGFGMTPETLAKAREPFFTTKAAPQGTGLGLAMVDATMRQAGGSMDIQSEPGVGTTIGLRFPVVTHAPLATRTESSLPEPDLPTRAATVLMIDKEITNRAIFSDFLREIGHRVLEVSNHTEGICIAQALETQLEWVVLDLDAQDTDLTSFIDRFSAFNPSLKIIGMTSDDSLQIEHVPVLHKPFSLDRLRTAMTASGGW